MTDQPRLLQPRHVIIIVAIVVAGVVAIFALSNKNATPDGSGRSPLLPPSVGAADAPVTMIEFADFQCVYCAMFSRDTVPALIDRYVDEGLLRIEWRHFPVFGETSRQAALAATCAHEQGAFWEYHDALFAATDKGTDQLVALATELDLNSSRFRTCLTEEHYAANVDADYWEGRAYGITGTPTFLVNDYLIVGAHPLENWHEIMEQVLEEAK